MKQLYWVSVSVEWPAWVCAIKVPPITVIKPLKLRLFCLSNRAKWKRWKEAIVWRPSIYTHEMSQDYRRHNGWRTNGVCYKYILCVLKGPWFDFNTSVIREWYLKMKRMTFMYTFFFFRWLVRLTIIKSKCLSQKCFLSFEIFFRPRHICEAFEAGTSITHTALLGDQNVSIDFFWLLCIVCYVP